jgi:hypothetical protein
MNLTFFKAKKVFADRLLYSASRASLISFIYFIALMLPADIFGQGFSEGYLITLANDTVRGKVALTFNKEAQTSILTFRDDSEKVYRPDEVKGFGILQGKKFISYNKLFLEVLVIGEIDLFRNGSMYYLRKNKGGVMEIERKTITKIINGRTYKQQDTEWVAVISQLVGDCLTNLDKRLKSVQLDEKTITQLVIDYNVCTEKPFVEVKKDIPWTRVSYGLSAGLVQSKIKFKNKPGALEFLPEKYATTSFSIGIPVTFSFPRATQRLAIQPEIYFIKTNYSEQIVAVNSIDTRYHDSYISIYTLSTPLSLKVNLTERSFSTFFNIGTNFDFNIKSESHQLSEVVRNNVVEVQPDRDFLEVPAFQLGFVGGIGIGRNFSRFSVSASLRHTVMITPVRVEETNGIVSRTSILIALSKR